MLSVYRLAGAAEAERYYAEVDDYRREGGSAPTEWQGRGAAALGLSGEVDPRTVSELLHGRLPTGEQLGRREGEGFNHAPGVDLTISAPKSVSIAACAHGDERVMAAHLEAVRETLKWYEQQGAATRIRQNGTVETVQTDNLIFATYLHETNRDQECQIHSHCVEMNATQDAEGQWRSVENKSAFRMQKEINAVYLSYMAPKMARIGYTVEHDERAKAGELGWRLAEISREEEAAFSSRSEAIEAWLAARGLTRETATAEQKKAAALATREKKQAADHGELRRQWKAQADAVRSQPFIRPTERDAGADRAEREAVAMQAVRDAAAHIAERETRFTARAVDLQALRFGGGRIDLADVQAARERMQAAGELIARETRSFNPATGQKEVGAGFTTRQGIETEARLVAAAQANPTAARIIEPGRVEAQIKRIEQQSRHAFNDSQRAAARDTLAGAQRVTLIQGYAGTAKTTSVLAAVADAAERRAERAAAAEKVAKAEKAFERAAPGQKGDTLAALRAAKAEAADVAKQARRVVALAPTNSAAQTLGDAIGNKGQTVAAFLGKGQTAGRGDVVIVDEASLLSAKDAARLMEATRGARVYLVGDTKQLGSVEAGAAFRQLQEAGGCKTVTLNEIVRQRDDELRGAVYDAVAGEAGRALARLPVQEMESRQDRIAAMAERIAGTDRAQRSKVIAITPGRDDRGELNAAIRERLASRGEIDRDKGREVMALESKDMTDISRRKVGSYARGDVIEAGRAYMSRGLSKGERVTVQDVDRARGVLICTDRHGRTVELDPRKQSKLTAYEPRQMEVAPGDVLAMRQKDHALGLKNGDRLTVERVTGDAIHARTQAGERVKLDTRAGVVAAYGYAQTAHEAQGRTCETVLIHAESQRVNLANQQSFYVAVSRAQGEAVIYTDDRQALAAQIERETGQKETAIEAPQLAADGLAPMERRGDGGAIEAPERAMPEWTHEAGGAGHAPAEIEHDRGGIDFGR